MNQTDVLELGREALWLILSTSAPIMIAGLLVGIVIAIFQALTTIQEMTLTFVPKILIIFTAIVVFLPFMMTSMVEFGVRIFDRIVGLGG